MLKSSCCHQGHYEELCPCLREMLDESEDEVTIISVTLMDRGGLKTIKIRQFLYTGEILVNN